MIQFDRRQSDCRKNEQGFTLIEILLAMGIFSTTLLIIMNVFVGSARLQQRSIVGQRLTSDARYTIEAMARAVRSGIIDYDFYAGLSPYEIPAGVGDIGDVTRPHHILSTIDQDGNRTIFRRRSIFADTTDEDPWGATQSAASDGNNYYNVGDQVEVCFETSICVDTNGNYNDSTKELCDVDCLRENESCVLSCNYRPNWTNITPEGVRLTGGIDHPDEPYGLNFMIRPNEDPNRIDSATGEYQSNLQPIVSIMLMSHGTGSSPDEQKTTFIQTAAASRVYQR